jgi:hypothetical protein
MCLRGYKEGRGRTIVWTGLWRQGGAPRARVQGFYTHLAVQEGCKPSSNRHIYKEFQTIQSWVAIVPGSLVFISFLYSSFEISKYIHLSLTGFPHGGFFQGHVSQNMMHSFVMHA